jgi:hypothetical protein
METGDITLRTGLVHCQPGRCGDPQTAFSLRFRQLIAPSVSQ